MSSPSVRNYAILSLDSRNLWGSVWSVIDRRSGERYKLIRPTWMVAWPRLYSALIHLSPIPIRQRNNKVALLIEDSSQKIALKGIVISKRAIFDPLIGFSAQPGLRLNYFVLPAVLLALAVLAMQPKLSSNDALKREPTCSVNPVVGSVLQINSSELTFGKYHYSIVREKANGGYRTLELESNCDSSRLRITAWFDGDSLVVQSVN